MRSLHKPSHSKAPIGKLVSASLEGGARPYIPGYPGEKGWRLTLLQSSFSEPEMKCCPRQGIRIQKASHSQAAFRQCSVLHGVWIVHTTQLPYICIPQRYIALFILIICQCSALRYCIRSLFIVFFLLLALHSSYP